MTRQFRIYHHFGRLGGFRDLIGLANDGMIFPKAQSILEFYLKSITPAQ